MDNVYNHKTIPKRFKTLSFQQRTSKSNIEQNKSPTHRVCLFHNNSVKTTLLETTLFAHLFYNITNTDIPYTIIQDPLTTPKRFKTLSFQQHKIMNRNKTQTQGLFIS